MKSKSIFIGIDPGLTGAIGAIDQDSRPIVVFDITTRSREMKETAIKNEFDALPTANMLAERVVHYPEHKIHGWIETPYSRPGKNMMSTTSLFQTYGGLMAMMEVLLDIKINTVQPSVWKKGFNLNSKKDYSLEIASQLWPTLGLNQAQYHNRAEAMLIAEYGRLKWHQENQFNKEES